MQSKTRDLLTHSWQSRANVSFFLFLLIVTVFILPSIGFEQSHWQLYDDIAFSVVVIFGCAIAWESRKLFVLTAVVCAAGIGTRWIAWWNPTDTLVLMSQAAGLAAAVALMGVLLWQVFRSGPVTATRIQAAIAVYLGLAFGWAHAYHIAALLDPGAFRIVQSDLSGAIDWTAYSFGMLTTAGFSGVIPLHSVAHSLSSAESVTGQLYLTVLVARLVSMQVSAAHNDRESLPE
jgi:voltage-gated potassium channel